MEKLDRTRLLTELDKSNFEIFHYNDNECCISLENDEEILVQLSRKSISREHVNLLKHILENHETYIQKAVQHLKSFGIDMENNYYVYGIYVGEFGFEAHGLHICNGFTISLKKWENIDPLNPDVFTVRFKGDGSPLGADLWFE